MKIDFQPKTRFETIVYQARTGEEIARLKGKVAINGKDYKDFLPIKFILVETTETLINSSTIDNINE